MPNPFLENIGVVLAAQETAEGGGAPVPTGTANAIMPLNFTPTVGGQPVTVNRIRQSLSAQASVLTLMNMGIEFDTELRTIGTVPTAGAPLREDPLFRAAAMLPTQNGVTDVTYNPTSDMFPTINQSAVVYAYISPGGTSSGLLFKLVGCRANMSANLTVGDFGKVHWTIQGALGTISNTPVGTDSIIDAALPTTITYQAPTFFAQPVQGITFTAGGYAAIISSFTFDLGNQVQQRLDATAANGIRSFFIGDREVVGTINPEAVLRADHDFFARWKNGTPGAINCVLGSGVGGTLTINMPAVQYTANALGTRNQLRTFENQFTATGTDNELSLKWS
jgi:hypothetical protein